MESHTAQIEELESGKEAADEKIGKLEEGGEATATKLGELSAGAEATKESLATVETDLDTDERLAANLRNLAKAGTGQQLAVGGVDIEGGQGESDSIFGSHDDHSTYGVAGSGWQGAGNGEPPGELWNPAVGRTRVMKGKKIRRSGGHGMSCSLNKRF